MFNKIVISIISLPNSAPLFYILVSLYVEILARNGPHLQKLH